MCGIAGSVNIEITDKTLSKINHRGPDSMGLKTFECNNHTIYLGQTRLSIVDLSDAGFQPMIDETGQYVILMNGEIYNHQELRSELSEFNFKGHSDTETVLYYLIKYGNKGISKLNGIFSICFYNISKSTLTLYRDPFGIKPLYYYLKENKLIFSSEIRVISDVINDIKLNDQCLYNYVRLRFCLSPDTLINGIKKLEPGHQIEFDLNDLNLNYDKEFFSYIPQKNVNINYQDALTKYDNLIRKAVERQLMSDVPIAIMLSGGVDSALLAYLVQDISGKKFDTFSVGFNLNSSANELKDAAETARWLGSNHNELILDEVNFNNYSSKLIDVLEEPVGSQSLYPFYFLTEQIANRGFKVALSGQGVDEAMAGYKRYNFQNLFDNYSNPIWKNLGFVNSLLKKDKLRRGINALSETNRSKRFIESYSFFDKNQLPSLFKDSKFLNDSFEDKLVKLLDDKSDFYKLNDKNGLDHMLVMDTRLALTDDLLLYTDKISMHHSLEVRVPFLDIELMEFVESLPTNFKSNIKQNKILHKELAEKYLPKEIIYRKKKGFYIPRNEWYKSESGDLFRTEILNDATIFSELFNKQFIIKMFDDHKIGIYNYEDQLYSIMNLYYWIKSNLK
jgi:asparagine synthase (glutamine-hydrolysing)